MAASYPLVVASPIPGVPYLGLRFGEGGLSVIDFLRAANGPLQASWHAAREAQEAQEALQAYFCDPDTAPVTRLMPAGTPYQQRVWQALQQIPCGKTVTYGELARQLESSARAVAGACRANPLPLLIPCHRVVAAHGLGGYMGQRSGEGMAIKQWLLHHEGHDS